MDGEKRKREGKKKRKRKSDILNILSRDREEKREKNFSSGEEEGIIVDRKQRWTVHRLGRGMGEAGVGGSAIPIRGCFSLGHRYSQLWPGLAQPHSNEGARIQVAVARSHSSIIHPFLQRSDPSCPLQSCNHVARASLMGENFFFLLALDKSYLIGILNNINKIIKLIFLK